MVSLQVLFLHTYHQIITINTVTLYPVTLYHTRIALIVGHLLALHAFVIARKLMLNQLASYFIHLRGFCHPFLGSSRGPCPTLAGHWKLSPPAAGLLAPVENCLSLEAEGKGSVQSTGKAA